MYTLLVVILTTKPIKFQHVYIPMAFSFVYVLFTWIYFLATDELIYSFLNWNKPGKFIILTFLFVFVCTPLAHFFFFGLYKLKRYIKQSCSSKRDLESTENKDNESKEEMLNHEKTNETPWLLWRDIITVAELPWSLESKETKQFIDNQSRWKLHIF